MCKESQKTIEMKRVYVSSALPMHSFVLCICKGQNVQRKEENMYRRNASRVGLISPLLYSNRYPLLKISGIFPWLWKRTCFPLAQQACVV